MASVPALTIDYEYPHDSQWSKPIQKDIYSNLEGHTFNGGAIPPDILCTKQRPDMVVINRYKKKIHILELTCSFEKNITSANLRKNPKLY